MVFHPERKTTVFVVLLVALAIPATAPYELGTRVRFPSGQTSSGLVAIRTFFFDNTTCTFPSFGGVVGPNVTSSVTDTWADSFITGVNPSPGALSTLVAIYVVKNEAGGTLSGLVDRVVLGPAGTTPVQLEFFTVE